MEEPKPTNREITPALRREIIRIVDDRISESHVTREDFSELKEIVRSIGVTMGELAEAQKRTEIRVEELAEAQKESRKDINRLERTMGELAEAQKRTEVRVEELAEAQKRTELRVEELAEAQKQTQHELSQLTQEHRETRRQLGGLAMSVGYGIEDSLMPYIFDFGRVEYGIKVESVERKNLVYDNGSYDEINIFAQGTKAGRTVYIIGECKAQPGKKDIERFYHQSLRVKEALDGEVFLFFVGYVFDPDTEHHVRTTYPEIRLLKTYEFSQNYQERKPSAR